MKRIFYPMILVLVLTGFAVARGLGPADPIAPRDVASRAGQATTVTGTVSNIFTDPRSGTTFIDMGGQYPNNIFTAVIFPDEAGKFPDVPALSGKAIAITGQIGMYRGKPEIILTSADQIQRQ